MHTNDFRISRGNPDEPLVVQSDMAISILEFNPALHQKVRYNQQLYAVLLKEVDFVSLAPDDEVVIHFISHEKIIVRASKQEQENYKVRKVELLPVEAHIIE